MGTSRGTGFWEPVLEQVLRESGLTRFGKRVSRFLGTRCALDWELGIGVFGVLMCFGEGVCSKFCEARYELAVGDTT